MPPRTQIFKMLPWVGGLNTALDPSMIPSNQLLAADNLVFKVSGSRLMRDGINHNWDSATAGTASIIGLHDFWFGPQTGKTQRQVGVDSNGNVYSYAGGTRTQLTVIGTAWTGTLTQVTMTTFNNKCFIAVSGAANVMKFWDGTNPVQDVYNSYQNPCLTRSSSGTTRTLVFQNSFLPAPLGPTVGQKVIISGAGNSNYNGTWTLSSITTTTVANDTLVYTATGTLSETSTAETAAVAGGPAPLASIVSQHQGRLVTNDKTNADRLNFSAPFDHTTWLGFGDSGAIDFGIGDGDPVGVNGIFPTFKGSLFVAKWSKLYRMDGGTPLDWDISTQSDGIGCVSHNAIVPVDQDDVFWMSENGFHSLNAVAAYGDFSSHNVSLDIQNIFSDGTLNRGQFPFAFGTYVNTINSVAFAVSETSGANRVLTSSGMNNAVYLYNIPLRAWYRWPDIPCQSMITANDADEKRLYFGTQTARVSKAMAGADFDTLPSGTTAPIALKIQTGQILLEQNPYQGMTTMTPGQMAYFKDPYLQKGLKRFGLIYRPQGTHVISAIITVDNQAVSPSNQLTFSQNGGAALLGSTFVLGRSQLGYTAVMSPYIMSIDGYGHSVQLTLTQSQQSSPIEILGFLVEWEPSGLMAEVF